MIKKRLVIYSSIILFIILLLCYFIVFTLDYSENSKNTQSHDKNISISNNTSTDLIVHFFDIGQADSIFIQDPSGKTMLIDAGNDEDSTYIIKYLKALNIDKIDYLVISHPHQDHIGGMEDIVATFNVGLIIRPKVKYNLQHNKDLQQEIDKNGCNMIYGKTGDSFSFGKSNFSILSPLKNSYDKLNNYSIILKLNFLKVSFLFMGDAEGKVLDDILATSMNLESDVIKIGHHGAKSSCPDKFIKAVKPTIAVLTVKNISFDFPHFNTLFTLANNGVRTYQTKGNGTIIVTSNGNHISVTRSSIINNDKDSLNK